MSCRIDRILEVLDEVRREYQQVRDPAEIVSLRQKATNKVAERRGIAYDSVTHKFRNELKPEILSTREFDRLVIDWLTERARVLRHILLDHAVEADDIFTIEAFFSRSSEKESEEEYH